MIKISNIFQKSAFVLFALFFISGKSYSQGDILELLPGSDRLEYDQKSGTHRLIGNVNFRYQGNTMYCDSAYYFERNQTVRAYGNVQIRKGDLNLYCDSIYYDGNAKNAKLWGNVNVRDGEYKLTTDTLNYDSESGKAYYLNGGKVQNILKKETLTSKIGYIYPESNNFFFSKQVRYENDKLKMTTDTLQYIYNKSTAYFHGPTNIEADSATMYCRSGWYNTESEDGYLQGDAWIKKEASYISGDTLIYQPSLGSYTGKGNVFYKDTTQQMSFQGDYAYSSDSLDYSLLTGHALAIKELDDDTLYVHADTLYTFKTESTDLIKAFHSAGIYSNSFQCRADSIVFNGDIEFLELYKNPVAWSESAELKGDTIFIELKDSLIQHAFIRNNATILMEVEPANYYNQIGGNNIRADFKDNEIYYSIAEGNARTVFFPEEEEIIDSVLTKTRQGMNRLYASDLKIAIDSNEISSITYVEEPDGAFYPMDQLKEDEQFIQGFEWKAVLRPKRKEDLFVHPE